MRIGMTYNLKPEILPDADDPIDRYEEFDSEETVAAIAASLRILGHEVERLGWGPALLDALLRRDGPRLDGVFNLAEGLGGRGRESQVPALLEMLGIPNTGSDPVALALALDKGLAKVFAADHGIATAPFVIVGADEPLTRVDLRYPLFAKPVAEGSSMGIRNTSVCRNHAELAALVAQLQHDSHQPVLIEEFLAGDEYTVGVLGNGDHAEVIGLMQVLPRHPGGDFVYSLEVKRDYENQVVYRMTDELVASGALTPAALHTIRRLALAAHKVFTCRDLSRVDIRCDRDGEPNFIEINPLPGLNPIHSDLVIIARGHGWDYHRLIARIVAIASERWATSAASATSATSATSAPRLDRPAANAQDQRRC